MENFGLTILTGFTVFPFIALLITLPYFIYNYHKYGSISKYRMLVLYSFVLYLLVAYFLVILPLPKRSYVALLTTPRYQLHLFQFIRDIINTSGFVISNFSTYIQALKSHAFYQAFYNVLLTVPFGMYLNYYFKYSFKKTLLFSLLLSLFFELTQLSGLYFIYPRGYRLFDVDDLLLNTLGGCFGYLLAKLLFFLPKREDIDNKSYKMSEKVTGIRRLVSFIIDIIYNNSIIGLIFILTYVIDKDIISKKYILLVFLIINFFFFVIIPLFCKQTLGKRVVNIKIMGRRKEAKWYARLFRCLFMYLYIFIAPWVIFYVYKISKVYSVSILLLYLLMLFISTIKLLISSELWYEIMTKTVNVNTLKKIQTKGEENEKISKEKLD